MTYPNITSEEMRQNAARTLVMWRKMGVQAKQRAVATDKQATRLMNMATAQMYESWIYGYRRALSDLGGW